jgi:2-succinyl-5-enolpyruvyl-6-hydroxy-3-cyclohexene-1-carboxylate synthase
VNAWIPAVDVVRRCLRAGLCEFVVCAGARNAALIEALARAEAAGHVRLWRHFEERAAAFFALGRTMDSGRPCAVVTTSGTAAAELLPAMIEGFYQNRPLVAITADRPAAFRGSGAPQSIDQTRLFGTHAADGNIEDWCGRMPLHWNVEFDETFEPGDEHFINETPGDFSPEKDRLDVAALARWLREDTYRGLAVIVGGLEPDEREEAFHFCRDLDAPVLVEGTSGPFTMQTAFSNPIHPEKSCVSGRCRAAAFGAIWRTFPRPQCGPSAAMAYPDWHALPPSPAARWIA